MPQNILRRKIYNQPHVIPMFYAYHNHTHIFGKMVQNDHRIHPSYAIKNSIELSKNIHNMEFPIGSKLILFDVVETFNTIPVFQSVALVVSKLIKKNLPNDIINEFRILISLCLNDNIRVFKKKKYHFPCDLPRRTCVQGSFVVFYIGP